jgi:hypothetical protein
MFVPTLGARVKQRDELAIDMSGEIRPLMEIAPVACETKVGFVISSVMLFGDDMLDVKSDEWQFILMTSAILAAVLGAKTNKSA